MINGGHSLALFGKSTHGTIRKSGQSIRTRCIGSTSKLLKRKDLSSIKHDRTQSSFTTHSKLIVVVMESGEIIHEKVHMSPRPPPKISFADNWIKELDSEVVGISGDSQRIQPKSKTKLSRTGRPVSEQPSGSFAQEIRKDVLFGRESTNSRTGRLVDGPPSSQSCVPVSVELVDKRRRRRRKRRRS